MTTINSDQLTALIGEITKTIATAANDAVIKGAGAASMNMVGAGAMLVSSGKCLKLHGYPTEKAIQLDTWLEDCERRLRISKIPAADWLLVACTRGGDAVCTLAARAGATLDGKTSWE